MNVLAHLTKQQTAQALLEELDAGSQSAKVQLSVSVLVVLSPSLASALLCVGASFSPTVNGFSVCGEETGSANRKERGIFPQKALGGKMPEKDFDWPAWVMCPNLV